MRYILSQTINSNKLWPIIENVDVATSTLSQTSDVTAVALDDTNATISISEYITMLRQPAMAGQ